MRLLCIGIVLIGCAAASETAVIDLGVVGTVFPIKERNIMTVLQEKFASPLGKKLAEDFENRLNALKESQHYLPAPNAALMPTPKHRSYLFNPSISLDRDLSDHNGTRFYKRGTTVNPLDQITLTKEYLFIDGDRPRQVDWAIDVQKHTSVMIILVKGDPMRVMRENNIHVFFDQEAAMATRFQLTHVPCSMAQENTNLRITEWVEEDLGKESDVFDHTLSKGAS